MIGIANALDVTDQFLSRLKAKNCDPKLLNSSPYHVLGTQEIIMDRIFSLEGSDDSAKEDTENKSSDDTAKVDKGSKSGDESKATAVAKRKKPKVPPLMQHPATDIYARGVIAATGDVRKALGNSRQPIEMGEFKTEKKKKRMMARHSVSATPTTKKRMPLLEISLAELKDRIADGSTNLVDGRTPHSRTRSTSSVPSLSVNSGGSTL